VKNIVKFLTTSVIGHSEQGTKDKGQMTSSTSDSSGRNGLDSAWNRLKQLVTSETFLYVVKRLLQALLTLLLASALSFAIIQLAPGITWMPQAEP
jgi:hypothetical protein